MGPLCRASCPPIPSPSGRPFRSWGWRSWELSRDLDEGKGDECPAPCGKKPAVTRRRREPHPPPNRDVQEPPVDSEGRGGGGAIQEDHAASASNAPRSRSA